MSKKLLFLFGLFAPMAFSLDDILPKGAVQFKLSYGAGDADHYLDEDEEAVPFFLNNAAAEFEGTRFAGEISYGLYHDITLVVKTGFVNREIVSPNGSLTNDGIPASYAGVLQRLNQPGRTFRLTAKTGVWVPIDGSFDEALPVGSQGLDWETAVGYSQDFFPTKGGFEMDFGYRFRNEEPDDEIFFDTAFKVSLFQLVDARVSLNVVESTEDERVAYDPVEFPFQRGFQKLGLDLSRNITKNTRIGLGYQQVLEGRNQFETTGWRAQITWRR